MEEINEVLNELKEVKPEKLTGEAKRLFEAIMKIADERDELEYKYNKAIEDLVKLEKERQADKGNIEQLQFAVKCLEGDIKNRYHEDVVLDILEEEFNIDRDEAIEILENY